jgi:hypothetical protein
LRSPSSASHLHLPLRGTVSTAAATGLAPAIGMEAVAGAAAMLGTTAGVAVIGTAIAASAARAGVGADGAGAALWGPGVNIYVIPRRCWSPRWGWVRCRYGYYPWGY